MKRTVAVLLAVLFLSATPSGADEVRFVRTPEISPDGSVVAFSYGGDIWTVPVEGGTATRITDHVAYDSYPVWSPDGSTVAFASDRRGNYNIFTIPAAGGEAKQITFDTSTDIPCDWTPGGGAILFQTRRNGSEDLWLAYVDGGTPVRMSGVFMEREAYADISNDGTRLVYNNNRCTSGWYRKNYRSSDAADVYLSDFMSGGIHPRPLTEEFHQDLWPHFSPDDSMVYYASGKTGPLNVYRMPANGGEYERVTRFDKDVTWISMPSQGDRFLVMAGFDVYTVPLERLSGEPNLVKIECNTEFKENTAEQIKFTSEVSGFSVSPDGKKTAIIVHGEIFVVPAEKGGEARRVTHTPWRETDVAWLSDSRHVVYASDRSGTLDLYKADTRTGEETHLTSGDDIDSRPVVSPDGDWIAFFRGNHLICRISPDGGDVEPIVRSDFLDLRLEGTHEFSWSPDSRWLAYTAYASDFHTDIHVRNIEDGEDHVVSYLATYNHRPVWSPDGEFLYFTSYFQENGDTYRVRLNEEDPTFEEDHLDSLYIEDDEDGEKDEEKDDAEEGPVPVEIDFTDIVLRVEAFPDLANDESEPVFVSGGETVVFVANVMGEGSHDLWSYPADENAEEKELDQLTSSGRRKGGLQPVEDAIWYIEEGSIKWYDTAKEKAGVLSFSAEMEIDEREDRRQIFLEAWSILDDQFYDPGFHGANWDEVKEKYGAIVPHARTRQDFQTLVRMMIGELNASHLGIWTGGGTPHPTGYLGIEPDYTLLHEQGIYKVQSVMADSPASLEESRVETGEYILSIDGIDIDRTVNVFDLLGGKVGKRVELVVAENEKGKNRRTVKIQPVSRGRFIGLQTEEWDRERRQMVDEWSGGRLAYLHIRNMGQGDLVKFRRELVTLAEEKDGAIIDVRYNGGGSIAVHVLGILERKPFLLRNFRGGPPTSETKMRSYSYEKPTACLINNHSYSNAEIFAEGFRKLELGPIVGIPTAGAVIGTGGWTMIDGTNFRKPSWGAYSIDGQNLENNGRKPDFDIYNDYKDWMKGDDPQLRKAVEELMKELD